MTDDRMALAALLEKGSDDDLLREMIGYVAQRLIQLDVEGLVGAGHGERGEGRENWRNGYRDREWHTRSGTTPLRIPKLRRGSYFFSGVPGAAADGGEGVGGGDPGGVIKGVSTRSVDDEHRDAVVVGTRGMNTIAAGVLRLRQPRYR